MTQNRDLHRLQQACPVVPEELLPPKAPDECDQRRIVAPDDGAAFVEEGEQIAKAPAMAVLARDLGGMPRVELCLGFREREPGQRVEQIMAVAGAGRHATRLVDAQLIVAL